MEIIGLGMRGLVTSLTDTYHLRYEGVGFGEILKTFKCLSSGIYFKKISLDLFPSEG